MKADGGYLIEVIRTGNHDLVSRLNNDPCVSPSKINGDQEPARKPRT